MKLMKKLFSGRLNIRTAYLGIMLQQIFLLIYPIDLYTATLSGEASVVDYGFFLILIFFGLSFQVRRAHDFGRDWKITLLYLLPVVGVFVPFFIGIWPGQDKDNKYGPQPPTKFEVKKLFWME